QRLIKTLPRKGFRFIGDVREATVAPAAVADPMQQPRPALALPDKPAVAVLPFTNMSGEADQEYFADGITDDIITELSRFSELFVIARNSSFQYKANRPTYAKSGGSLAWVCIGGQHPPKRRPCRVGAQLIDATTGRALIFCRYATARDTSSTTSQTHGPTSGSLNLRSTRSRSRVERQASSCSAHFV